jgi:hypothetical protein
MAYCAYSCPYSRLLVKYLLARSRNLLWPLDEETLNKYWSINRNVFVFHSITILFLYYKNKI